MTSEIEKFFRFLQLEKSLAVNSIEAYRHDIARYAAFLAERGIAAANNAAGDDVAAFIHELHRLGLSSRSVARNLSAVKSFHKFLLGEKITAGDPTVNIELPKRGKFLPDVLSVGEINRIIDATSLKKADAKKLWIRDRAILETLYATGMRVSELTELKQSNVSYDDELVRVFGKGSKERLVPIGRPALNWIRRYQTEVRGKLASARVANNAVFLNWRGRSMSRAAIWNIVKEVQPPRTHLERSPPPHVSPLVRHASS